MALMPYYPDVAGAPQNSLIGGASLWVMPGKTAAEYKGVARFLTFPITQAAYERTKASGFYERNPSLEGGLLELTRKPLTENSRGLRLLGMVQLREVWAEEIEGALSGEKWKPWTALSSVEAKS